MHILDAEAKRKSITDCLSMMDFLGLALSIGHFVNFLMIMSLCRAFSLTPKSNDLFLNLGCLTNLLTDVVKLSTSNLTGADDINLNYIGRMYGEGLLNAYAIGNTSYCEGLGDSAAVLCDDGSFEHLDSLSCTLNDFVVNSDSITDVENRCCLLQLLICKSLNKIHFWLLLKIRTFVPSIGRGLSFSLYAKCA